MGWDMGGRECSSTPVWLQGKLLMASPPPHQLWAEAPLGDPKHSHSQDNPTMPVPAPVWGHHSSLQPPIASTSISPHSPPDPK